MTIQGSELEVEKVGQKLIWSTFSFSIRNCNELLNSIVQAPGIFE